MFHPHRIHRESVRAIGVVEAGAGAAAASGLVLGRHGREPVFGSELIPDQLRGSSAALDYAVFVVDHKLPVPDLEVTVGHDVANREAVRVQEVVERFGRGRTRTDEEAGGVDRDEVRLGADGKATTLTTRCGTRRTRPLHFRSVRPIMETLVDSSSDVSLESERLGSGRAVGWLSRRALRLGNMRHTRWVRSRQSAAHRSFAGSSP